MIHRVLLVCALCVGFSCYGYVIEGGDSGETDGDGDMDADTDVDGDVDSDVDSDSDSDSDADSDADVDADEPVIDADPEEEDPEDADPVEPPEGDCRNAADQAEIERTDENALLTACGARCLPGLTMECVRLCVDDETDLSAGCIECFVGYAECVMTMCLGSCLGDVASVECASCRAIHCDSDYVACTGLDAP